MKKNIKTKKQNKKNEALKQKLIKKAEQTASARLEKKKAEQKAHSKIEEQKKKNTEKSLKNHYKKIFRDNRIVDGNLKKFEQNLPKNGNENFEDYAADSLYIYFNKNLKSELQDLQSNIFKVNNVQRHIALKFKAIFRKKNKINNFQGFTYSQPFFIYRNEDFDVSTIRFLVIQSSVEIEIIGYKGFYGIIDDISEIDARVAQIQAVRALKAYSPNDNKDYHNKTLCSTTIDRDCIYETYVYLTKKIDMKFIRGKQNKDKIKEMLSKEGEEIIDAIKKGELIKACELLTKKDNKTVYITKYNETITENILTETPLFKISNGILSIIDLENKKKLYGKIKVFLYNQQHVAPALYTLPDNKGKINKAKNIEFKLKPADKAIQDKKIEIYGFDTETFKDDDGSSYIFNITLVGEKIKQSFYGINCYDDFIEYLDKNLLIKVNSKKSKENKKNEYKYIYGFNNSNFDNLLMFYELSLKNPNMEIRFTESSIKYMKYFNICFFDISLFYKEGDLRNTCKKFKLEKEKGVYPYKFPNRNNLNYIGEVPELKYWNNQNDMNEFNKNNKMFNMKEYTEKYCLLDSELVYELGKIHIKSSTGTINNKNYDTRKKATGASIALSIYNQVFQKDILYQSPDDIIKKEKEAYKGGRTEVFKKYGKNLNYYDINSSFPYSMTFIMPYKYLRTIKGERIIKNKDDIVDINLYCAKSKYMGDNKNIIPNLLIRNDKGCILSALNSDFSYHWGCELKEAIENNFEIIINEENIYEGKPIFKDYAEYFYNERLKVKGKNDALAMFYKLLLNSLYGKFAQNKNLNTRLCENTNEVFKIINGLTTKLNTFEFIKDKILITYEESGDDKKCIGNLVRFSSYIAALSRCNLSKMMRDVGHEHIYYCDTDSIFTDKKPSSNLIDSKILGKWKLENEIEEAIFLAPKCYYYKIKNEEDEIMKAKGFNTKKNIKEDGNRINKIDYENLVNGKIKNIELSGVMFYKTFENIKIKDNQVRTLETVYNKRIWINNESLPYNNIKEIK